MSAAGPYPAVKQDSDHLLDLPLADRKRSSSGGQTSNHAAQKIKRLKRPGASVQMAAREIPGKMETFLLKPACTTTQAINSCAILCQMLELLASHLR